MRRGNHRKFGRETIQRKALYKALATALIEHGQIKTTSAKAKSLASVIEHLITLAKRQNLNARRELASQIGEKSVKKLMDQVAKDYADRNGGYTRIISLGQRKSDGAQTSIIELVK